MKNGVPAGREDREDQQALTALIPVDWLPILGQHLLNGVLIGCAYALIAMGLTMIFGVMNIANFAHGEFYMLGGVLAFYLVKPVGVNYFAALPLAVAAGASRWRVLIEKGVFKRLRDAPMMTTTLVTIGLSIFLEQLAHVLWGPQPQVGAQRRSTPSR